jgi:uncharacterized protein (DUF1697 family)
MPQHVAFIRAINVAGHAKIKMDAVKAVFAAAGCANVGSYLHSGNVVFDAPARATAALIANVRGRLSVLLGEEAVVLVRPLAELVEMVHSAPFGARTEDRALKLYVVFLARKPRTVGLPLTDARERLEAIRIERRAAFVVSARKRSGFYGMPNAFIEQALGVPATSRNWSTVCKLAALLAT